MNKVYRYIIKNIFDYILALILLPILVLFSFPIMFLIYIGDFSNPIFMSKRIGKDGKIFTMYKFRTMKKNSPDIRLEDGSTYNSKDDNRVTKIGKLLRKTSIDELPQIINILLGNMSFVGPRPDPVDWIDKYPKEYREFLKCKPGITGYNQAFFRNSADGYKKIENDFYYYKNISLFFDIKIVIMTFYTVIFNKNIYKNYVT